jgi:hypothetical protein
MPRNVTLEVLLAADFDFASGLDVKMDLLHNSPLSKAMAASIENNVISTYGFIHYLSILCQTKLSRLAKVGTTMSRMAHKDMSPSQSKLLCFVRHIIYEKEADGSVFSSSVQALWDADPVWQRMARTFVDMVIVWTRKFRVSPLDFASINRIPVLYPEHLFELFEGIGNAEITNRVASVIFASDEMALCRMLKTDKTRLQKLIVDDLYKLRCARTHSLFLDTREQKAGINNNGQPTRTSYIVSRLGEMYKKGEFRVISRYQRTQLTVSVFDLQNILTVYRGYTLIDFKDSLFGYLPRYRLNSDSDNFVIALVIDYSLRIYGQPSVLLESNFCDAVARGCSGPSHKVQRGRIGRAETHVGHQSFTAIQSIRDIFSRGTFKWIPYENWCSIISA